MNVPVKGSSSGGVESSSSSKPNPWSDFPKKNINRNAISGVPKMGTRFENLKDSEKTDFPKPSALKPVGASKLPLNIAKPSLPSGSGPTNGSAAEKSIGVTGVPKAPSFGLKPKPIVSTIHSRLAQENAPESVKKDKMEKTLSSNKLFPLLNQQPPLVNKSVDVSSEGQTDINKAMPPKPPSAVSSILLKPNVFRKNPSITDDTNTTEKTTEDSAPKIKPLPNVFTLGKCPSKPKRPPHVNLEKFKSKSTPTSINDTPSSQAIYVVPDSETSDTAVQEESYDDVGVLSPSLSHSGSIIQPCESAEEDEEMYEDLEERWAENEQADITKTSKEDKKKCDKEGKKRLEQEKKEQKMREKKEREARKKFKISGPIVVLQEVKSRMDSKGGKAELPLTQGETIEIVRLTDNPEGLWLARNSDGLYGYVKTAALEMDHSTLKTQTGQIPDGAGEVYDDVGVTDVSVPCPPHVGASPANDVYDDVDSQTFPPPPPPLTNHPSGKTEEADVKKKKKIEKEEKEFRKKFKYDGEISVLYQAVVDPGLTTKKWGNKDLPLKPGETIDVIVKPQDDKLIGRNKDGKFGYVSIKNIQQDAEIYDDIGEDCIYDN